MFIAFAGLLLLAANTSVLIVDEEYEIPARDWRYVELSLKQRPGLVAARYEAQSGAQQVRLALMHRDDLERLRSGSSHDVMSMTPPAGAGALNFRVREPGDYVVVVENRSRRPANVHLKVSLDFSGRRGSEITRISPERRLTVILLSFAFFFGIVTYSARRLMHVIKR